VEDATREDWLAALDVNVIGTALCSKYAVAAMQKQGRGSIVNVASINGLVAMPNWVTYNATKAAIVNMSKSMALDLGPFNIRVNCVCPGITRTPALDVVLGEMGLSMQEAEKIFAEPRCIIKRFGTAEEIAPAILFLASEEASYLTGATIVVDGGFTA
jgi:dihydroanticapsin dehydrogenase